MASTIGAIDREIEACGQRDGAQHADRIFDEPFVRIADAADHAGPQIGQPAGVVDDRKRRDVVEERVDREVAAERVLFRRAERVVVVHQLHVRPPTVDGSGGGTPCLADDLRPAEPDAGRSRLRYLGSKLDVRQAEAPADDPAVPKELLDLVGVRRRADVEILRDARAAGRERCRRRDRPRGRTAAAGREPSARRGRCRGARSRCSARGMTRGVRPSAHVCPNDRPVLPWRDAPMLCCASMKLRSAAVPGERSSGGRRARTLSPARALYNQRNFDAAVIAAADGGRSGTSPMPPTL